MDNGCGGDGEVDCCEPGSVDYLNGVVDVLPYLQRPAEWPFSADPDVDDSCTVDDSPGIAKAIECAASLSTLRRTVYFPAGRYVVRTPIRPHYDDLTLTGPELSADAASGDPDTATLVAVPCNPEQFPGVIQIDAALRGDNTTPEVINEVWIRNFQVALTDGPRSNANSGIRVNRCSSCLVENVIMRYEPLVEELPSCKPSNLDGITFSLGSGGTIRNVIVDGVPKGGIYLSSNPAVHGTPSIEVENCELKNINGPVGATALKIISANATVRNCEIHHNQVHPTSGSGVNGGHGIQIFTQSPPNAPVSVPADIRIEDTYFHHNAGSGVVLASATPGYVPTGIRFYRVKSAYNQYYGVNIQAGTDVEMKDVWAWGNGSYGMYLTAKSHLPASTFRIGDVILEDPLVFNNNLKFGSGPNNPGIRIQASDVTVLGGEVAVCNEEGEVLGKSVQQMCWRTGPEETLFYPVGNVVSGVIATTTSEPEIADCPYD
ncbi:right-handed parallel beta-helix repeat-containing protein [Sorangium cellulosum]|uniref:right-handed parallel beta-helix repeat-containing protein n=1 Tax=Sorangium cellulosum TaxID=56 RepID=UPI001F17BDDE|nr:right-handed parallel beta-helix repeat-containing protein [Sorangium cellulosum]